MKKRRRYGSGASASSSYFTTCSGCGERIHLREMPYGQWVAFDGPNSTHKCGQRSQYDPWPSSSKGTGGNGYPATTRASSTSTGLPHSLTPGHPHQPSKTSKIPTWVWWLIVIAVFYLVMKK